jgi:ketosteroid isomerase-like protein
MSRENVEVVRRLFEAFERDDLPGALSCLDPAIEWVPAPAEIEGAYHGHRGFERWVADTRETFGTFEPRFELWDLGDRVLAWGRISAQGSGSGVDMDFAFGGIFDLRDGRIVHWQDFGSRSKALEAAGVAE